MSKLTVSFDSLDFETVVPGLRITNINPNRVNRLLNIGHLANTDRAVMPAAYWDAKKINVTVEIGQNDRDLMEAAFDKLKAILQAEEAPLILGFGGSTTRKWTATMSNISITEPTQGGLGVIEIEFQAADPAGYDVSPTTMFSETRTNSASSPAFYLSGGSHKWQQPILTLTLTNVVGGSNQTVTISNSLTGQTLEITRNWLSGDVLVINSNTSSVQVNGVEVDSTGAIPEWNNGAGTCDYSDTFTSRTRTFAGIYYKRYL